MSNKNKTSKKNKKHLKGETCFKIGAIGCLAIIFLCGLLAASALIYRKLKTKPTTSVKKQLIQTSDSGKITNQKYNYSIDVGTLKDRFFEVPESDPERKSYYVDSFNYCFDVSDQSQSDSFCNQPGQINIFSIHVLNKAQYDQVQNAPMSVLQELGQKDNLYFMFSHPNGLLPEEVRGDFLENVKESFRFEDEGGSYKKEETQEDKTTKDLAANAKTYYNCKYRYTLKYPEHWAISDSTHESDKVFLYNDDVQITFTAHLNEGLTINQWTEKKKNQYPGTLKETRQTNRTDANGILLAYQDPESLVFFWPEGNHIMEMHATGKGYRNDHPGAYVVGSSLQISQTLTQCPATIYQQPTVPYIQPTSPPLQPTTPPQQTTVDPNTCQHPNGDVWLWWNDATPEEQECFMLKYPDSPFFRQ